MVPEELRVYLCHVPEPPGRPSCLPSSPLTPLNLLPGEELRWAPDLRACEADTAGVSWTPWVVQLEGVVGREQELSWAVGEEGTPGGEGQEQRESRPDQGFQAEEREDMGKRENK